MKTKYSFSGNGTTKEDKCPIVIGDITICCGTSSKSYDFVTNQDKFYHSHCPNYSIESISVREKRFLNFETPNRAIITHEYDLLTSNNESNDNLDVFVFNPIDSVGWLNASVNGQERVVLDAESIKNILSELFSDEAQMLLSTPEANAKELVDILWNNKSGKPCWVHLLKKDLKDASVLSVSYYDSLVEKRYNSKAICQGFNFISKLIFPLDKRVIDYYYYPLKEKSSWLYIKTPSNFNIKYIAHTHRVGYDIDWVRGSDPDVLALRIHGYNSKIYSDPVPISFVIETPKSLKVWYISIYISSLVASILLLLDCINKLIFTRIGKPLIIGDILDQISSYKEFHTILLALVAAIIATRGWLLKEETIVKRYSIAVTILMVLLIVLFLIDKCVSFSPL